MLYLRQVEESRLWGKRVTDEEKGWRQEMEMDRMARSLRPWRRTSSVGYNSVSMAWKKLTTMLEAGGGAGMMEALACHPLGQSLWRSVLDVADL